MSQQQRQIIAQLSAQNLSVSPLYDKPAFCLLIAQDIVYVPQNYQSLKDLVDFLFDHDYDLGRIAEDLVVDHAELAGYWLGKKDRISWLPLSQVDPRKMLRNRYITLREWLQDENMIRKIKPIVQGPFKGLRLRRVEKSGFWQLIVQQDDQPASVFGIKLCALPYFLVSWMVDYPLYPVH